MESDEELMAAVARGEERALATLVERHAARLHAFLVRIAGSRDEADDLLQDTWVRRRAPADRARRECRRRVPAVARRVRSRALRRLSPARC